MDDITFNPHGLKNDVWRPAIFMEKIRNTFYVKKKNWNLILSILGMLYLF
jgi:hypothetical protein